MKLFHLSDLHLGKRAGEFSLLEDQAYILEQILRLMDQERPDAVLIAGDVYDKSVPAVEAVRLFDDFLWQVSKRKAKALIISGNHDSPERMAFGGRIMRKGEVYLAPVFDGNLSPISLTDEHGPVDVYLLPFMKPVHARQCFPDADIGTYTDALGQAVARMPLRPSHRNVLLAHQFVTGAGRCESEEVVVGGLDNVDPGLFEPFDYVALGHLHSPQSVGRDTLRYCGSPLQYSFSEAGQTKSVTCVHLAQKGDLSIRALPLTPLREMREIRGPYAEVTSRAYSQSPHAQDYLHVILTDEQDVPDAAGRLRAFYPNLMRLSYDNTRTRSQACLTVTRQVARRSPMAFFAQFYEAQNGQPLTPEQERYLQRLMEQIWEEKT